MRFPIRIFKVSDRSMEPALHDGDYILVWCLRPRLHKDDIVVLAHPSKEMTLVKRIGRIDGDYCFVVGDNSESSEDSRKFGTVNSNDIIGKVILKI